VAVGSSLKYRPFNNEKGKPFGRENMEKEDVIVSLVVFVYGLSARFIGVRIASAAWRSFSRHERRPWKTSRFYELFFPVDHFLSESRFLTMKKVRWVLPVARFRWETYVVFTSWLWLPRVVWGVVVGTFLWVLKIALCFAGILFNLIFWIAKEYIGSPTQPTLEEKE